MKRIKRDTEYRSWIFGIRFRVIHVSRPEGAKYRIVTSKIMSRPFRGKYYVTDEKTFSRMMIAEVGRRK